MATPRRNARPEALAYPEAIETEKLVLGAALTDPNALEPILALQREDWAIEAHRQIWDAAYGVWREGGQVDRMTVAQRLMEDGRLDAVGGLTYLVELDNNLPKVYGLDTYLATIREKSALRRAAMEAERLRAALCAPGAGLDELRNAETLLRSLQEGARPEQSSLRTFGDHLDAIGGQDAFLRPVEAGVPTPWPTLNRFLSGGGFGAGQLIVLGAATGTGKTAAAALIARTAAEYTGVAVFSLEMAEGEIWRRLIAAESGTRLKSILDGQVHTDLAERHRIAQAMNTLSERPIYIDDSSAATVPKIVRAIRKRTGVGLAIIDYLQLLEPQRTRDSRAVEVSELTRRLKVAAMQLKIPFLVLSQINRDGPKEKREPQLYDLRESGSIEQDANTVLFLHSEPGEADSAYAERRPQRITLIIAKQRNGPRGKVKLEFDGRVMSMREVEQV